VHFVFKILSDCNHLFPINIIINLKERPDQNPNLICVVSLKIVQIEATLYIGTMYKLSHIRTTVHFPHILRQLKDYNVAMKSVSFLIVPSGWKILTLCSGYVCIALIFLLYIDSMWSKGNLNIL